MFDVELQIQQCLKRHYKCRLAWDKVYHLNQDELVGKVEFIFC